MEHEEPQAVDELTFANEVGRDQPRLVVGALLYAREIAYPDLKPSRYLARLSEWAEAFRFHSRRDERAIERGQALARFIFTDLGIKGNEAEYHDPRNSFLNEVMDRRLGLPITLSALFLHVARRVGIEAEGVGLPGHFIVSVRDGETRWFFDPWEGDEPLTRDDLTDLLERRAGYRGPLKPEWLEPPDTRAILARMLTNLRGAYVTQHDWPKAAGAIEKLVVLHPEVAPHYRDLGFVLARAGRPISAAQQLQRYLRLEPDAEDAAMVRETMEKLAEQGARLN